MFRSTALQCVRSLYPSQGNYSTRSSQIKSQKQIAGFAVRGSWNREEFLLHSIKRLFSKVGKFDPRFGAVWSSQKHTNSTSSNKTTKIKQNKHSINRGKTA